MSPQKKIRIEDLRNPVLSDIQKAALAHGEDNPVELSVSAVLDAAMERTGLSNFGAEDYSGYTDLVGLDLRRGFKQKWEAGMHTSVYHAYESNIVDYGVGLDLGLNIRDNIWVTLGYNIAGFHDADFAEARFTAQGPYLRVSIKTDQETLKRIAGR